MENVKQKGIELGWQIVEPNKGCISFVRLNNRLNVFPSSLKFAISANGIQKYGQADYLTDFIELLEMDSSEFKKCLDHIR